MAYPVRVEVTLVIEETLQPGQTVFDLASSVQESWQAQGMNVGDVQVQDGPRSFSLSTGIVSDVQHTQKSAKPKNVSEAGDGSAAYRTFNLRSGKRSVSLSPDGANANPIDDGTGATGTPSNIDAHLRNPRKAKKAARKAARLARATDGHILTKKEKRAIAQDGSIDRRFKHNFEGIAFAKTVQKKGLTAALASQSTGVRKSLNKRTAQREKRRWGAAEDLNEDKKLELLTKELESAFDVITPAAAEKSEGASNSQAESVANMSMEPSVSVPKPGSGNGATANGQKGTGGPEAADALLNTDMFNESTTAGIDLVNMMFRVFDEQI